MNTDESQSAEAESPDQTASTPATAKIKIGSQRPGVSTRISEPTPVIAPKPVTPPAPRLGEGDEEEKPAERKFSTPTKHYPPPNIRDRLSPDLEMEFAEAIGGVAVDEMLSSELP